MPAANRVPGRESLSVAASPIADCDVPGVEGHQLSPTTRTRPLSTWSSVSGVSATSSLGPPAQHVISRAHSWHTDRPQALDPVDEDAIDDAPSRLSSAPNDKASRLLGIQHNSHMEPIPASRRTSLAPSTRSTPAPTASSATKDPLCALYLVSGLPKSPQTWTLADADSTAGLHHTEGAVNRWWRPEVLGSTASPGVGGARKALRKKHSVELLKGGGLLSKQDIGKMLSKSLKLSFTREVEIVASTLQPPSTVHSFTFSLPQTANPYGISASGDLLRGSAFPGGHGGGGPSFLSADPFAQPSSAMIGPSAMTMISSRSMPGSPISDARQDPNSSAEEGTAYYGVCLTVWSHADAERTAAIRRALEGRARKESVHSLRAARINALRAQAGAPPVPSPRRMRSRKYSDTETNADTDAEGMETEAEGAMTEYAESEYEGGSTSAQAAPGASTVFLPGDAVFWLPYALTLVSRFPVFDLMRDYLTLSWARFSKDVQSHTLQIAKILAHPAPRAGELVRLDASAPGDAPGAGLEVIARFPGGLDFGQGLVDANVTMWPLFKALNVDNVLTICEIALAPTGRVLFHSRYPAMLGIAVSTIKYLLELRGWSGLALPAVHCRDARIYVEDPGPWLIGMAAETRYAVRPSPEVCVVDLDINYLSCPSPPPGVVSMKAQRDKCRTRLLSTFGDRFHPDHCVPSEFKEAFPAGRFRPLCRVQSSRGAASAAVADPIPEPEWWNGPRIIQAFDEVLRARTRPPSLLRRIASLGTPLRPPALSRAETAAQTMLRRRARAFVDAQDDLHSRIGRLSRRLNFLLAEADAWRDRFMGFESHAEQLASEAAALRAKVQREQRDARRASVLNAAEKAELTARLRSAEEAHQRAAQEAADMRSQMLGLEDERAAMIAEVEAQIESAIAAMAVGLDAPGDDLFDSGSDGEVTSRKSKSKSRKNSMASLRKLKVGHMAQSPTEQTLVDVPPLPSSSSSKDRLLVPEDKDSAAAKIANRFSVHGSDAEDNMTAVDEGINKTSDSIAQKMNAIQRKLDSAMSADSMPPASPVSSESEYSVDSGRPTPQRGGRRRATTLTRTRKKRGSIASTVRSGSTVRYHGSDADESDMEAGRSRPRDLPRLVTSPPIPESNEKFKFPAHSPSTPALTPGVVGSTDDSDADSQDYQSAYSMSPRTSTVGH